MEQKYGVESVTCIGTYGTLKIKAAFKDLCRFYGLNFKYVNYISSILPADLDFSNLFKFSAHDNNTIKKFIQEYPHIIEKLPLIIEQAKNTSVHAAGVVIVPHTDEVGNPKNIYDWMPVRKVDGILVSEWEGGFIDQIGFLKCDILGIKQLDKFDLINRTILETTGKDIRFDDIEFNDREVFLYFHRGWNEDVFQFGAAGLRGYCQELQPDTIEDLVATVALYRPGPMEIGAHKDYIKLKNGLQSPDYNFGTEKITKDTFGELIFQEQIIKIVEEVGGLTETEADDVRKCLHKDSLFYTKEEGYISISNIDINKHTVLTFEDSVNIFRKLSNVWCVGFKDCIKITTEDGNYQLICTPDHRIWASNDNEQTFSWFEAKDSLGLTIFSDQFSGFGHTKIYSIEYIGREWVWDFTMEDQETPQAFVGGMLVHNSMGKKDKKLLDKYKTVFIEGAIKNDCPPDEAVEMWDKMEGFGKYAFNRCLSGYEKILLSDGSYVSIRLLYRLKQVLESTLDYSVIDLSEYKSYSLTKELTLELNSLVDIRYEGIRDIYRLYTTQARTIDVTDNHKFPTTNGEKMLKDLDKSKDLLYIRDKEGNLTTEEILCIDFLSTDEVYDVEMTGPNHTFVVESGIITCNSHAVCYAMTGYYSQWYKVHYPLAFWVTSLQFSDEAEIQKRISEINKNSKIKLHPVDINKSQKEYVIDYKNNAIYWSLLSVKNLGEKAFFGISQMKEKGGDVYSLTEFLTRALEFKSVINKRVILNLIFSGAFDEVENIQSPMKRLDILLTYFRFIGKKLPEELEEVAKWVEYNFILKQKELTGYGYIDFRKTFHSAKKFKIEEYYEIEQLQSPTYENKIVSVIGILTASVDRKSRNGPFCQLEFNCNSEIFYVTCWSESFEIYKQIIKDSIGKILIISGRLVFDANFKKTNTIHTISKTKIEVL